MLSEQLKEGKVALQPPTRVCVHLRRCHEEGHWPGSPELTEGQGDPRLEKAGESRDTTLRPDPDAPASERSLHLRGPWAWLCPELPARTHSSLLRTTHKQLSQLQARWPGLRGFN